MRQRTRLLRVRLVLLRIKRETLAGEGGAEGSWSRSVMFHGYRERGK